jgi:ABC-type antimicrobial peptide transport system permease subunit
MNQYNQFIRNLSSNKGFIYVKITSLVLGIAVTLLIGLWVHDELSFNRYHANYSSIAKVMRNENVNRGDINTSDVLTTGMGTLLKTQYENHFSGIALVRGRVEERIISSGEKKHMEEGYFMQPDAPRMLSLEMISGTQNGLNDINSILLSESVAQKLFGDSNAIGQMVKMDATFDLMVTGVYKDLPRNTEFADAKYIAPLDRYLDGWSNLNTWNNYNMYLLVQLKPGASFPETSSAIRHALRQYDPKTNTELFLHPMQRWHLHSSFQNGVEISTSRSEMLRILIAIGLLILMLACINYVNLCTSRSDFYAREIGIRKTFGSTRFWIIRQILNESMLTVLIAYLFALVTLMLSLGWFNQVSGKDLQIPWNSWQFWTVSIGFLLMVNMLAGIYPALYLSKLKPLKAITGLHNKMRLGVSSREILVVFQFTISIALIIGSLIIYKQILHAKNRPVGYTPEGLLTLYMNTPDYKGKFLALRDELKKTGAVYEITASNYPVTTTKGWNSDFTWKNQKVKEESPSFNVVRITPEYCKTLGLQFLQGRDFSRDMKSDLSTIIINESALKMMELPSPIGETIYRTNPPYNDKPSYTILGVVKDMVKGSPFDPAVPTILIPTEEDQKHLYIRINPANSAAQALPKIENILKKIVPAAPFDYAFVDDQYNEKFKEEERTGKLVALFTFIAIIISSLGLFGLAAFVAEKRTKEIGVRRVNGARMSEILVMLNGNFLKWVILSCLLACPIAWYAMHKWLENFAYKTELSWWVFAASGAIALIIALFTVSWQSWRAATRNPVESLRYE